MNLRTPLALALALAACAAGCRTHHEVVTTSEVKPIHITIDVNIKVDRALDDFFGDIDEAKAAEAPQPTGAQGK